VTFLPRHAGRGAKIATKGRPTHLRKKERDGLAKDPYGVLRGGQLRQDADAARWTVDRGAMD
jgi:hypothetical protein